VTDIFREKVQDMVEVKVKGRQINEMEQVLKGRKKVNHVLMWS